MLALQQRCEDDAAVEPGLGIVMVVGPAAMVLVAAVSCAAARGRLARNGFVGLRLPSTMASDAGWVAGHRAAVRPALVAAAVLLIGDVIVVTAIRSASSSQAATVVLVVLLVAAIAIVTIVSDRAARRAGRA